MLTPLTVALRAWGQPERQSTGFVQSPLPEPGTPASSRLWSLQQREGRLLEFGQKNRCV